MTDKEHDPNAPPRQPAGAKRGEKRPYKTPQVESHPLFERMALNCTPWMKGTGEDDFS